MLSYSAWALMEVTRVGVAWTLVLAAAGLGREMMSSSGT
jgi:hypothetical protein